MQRRGITLLEVLVCIGIIGLVVAIAIPAVQYAREASRRSQCQSHLRQMTLGVQLHHGAKGTLPPLYDGTSLSYPLEPWELFNFHSWRVSLLPYVEQVPLRNAVDWSTLATEPGNSSIAQSVVPLFLCPSGGDPKFMGRGLRYNAFADWPTDTTEQDYYQAVRSDYDAMAGVQVFPEPQPPVELRESVRWVRWGIWGRPEFERPRWNLQLIRCRPGKFRDIEDGLSHTIAIVERAGKPIEMLDGRPYVTDTNRNAEYPGQVGWSASDTFEWSIHKNNYGVNKRNSCGIYSFHHGGANIALADGSVHFISDSIDFGMLAKLYGRSDGEVSQLQ